MHALILLLALMAPMQGGQATSVRRGANLPSTCKPGDVFLKNNVGLHWCNVNAWVFIAPDVTPPACVDMGGSHLNADSNGALYCGVTTGSFPRSYVSWNSGNITTLSCATTTFPLLNAAVGDFVVPSWPATLNDGITGTMTVSAADTIQVRICNVTGSSINPGALTYAAMLIK